MKTSSREGIHGSCKPRLRPLSVPPFKSDRVCENYTQLGHVGHLLPWFTIYFALTNGGGVFTHISRSLLVSVIASLGRETELKLWARLLRLTHQALSVPPWSLTVSSLQPVRATHMLVTSEACVVFLVRGVTRMKIVSLSFHTDTSAKLGEASSSTNWLYSKTSIAVFSWDTNKDGDLFSNTKNKQTPP